MKSSNRLSQTEQEHTYKTKQWSYTPYRIRYLYTFSYLNKKAQPIKRFTFYTMFIFLTKTEKAKALVRAPTSVWSGPEGEVAL